MRDLPWALEPLVRGDDAETRTRRRYARWAEAALAATEDTQDEASGPEPGASWGSQARGEVDWAVPPTESIARVDGRVLEEAAAAGWLVPDTIDERALDVPERAVAVKDVIDVAGVWTRNGTPRGLWRLPAMSADCWSALERAGFVSLGKVATHEMAWGVTTPGVPHPLEPSWSAGGSSGGSAALVASGVCGVALGTDTGGSVRIPAALCGVVGFRPSWGSSSLAGVTPLAPEQDTIGVLGRDVARTVAALERVLGRPLTSGSPDLPPSRRIGTLTSLGPVDPAVRVAYETAVATCADAGMDVVGVDPEPGRRAAGVSLLTMLISSSRQHADHVRADPGGFGSEARALLTLAERVDGDPVRFERERVRERSAALFARERIDAVITPTVPCPPPRRDGDVVSIAGREMPVSAALTRFCSWAAVVGMPAVTVPVPAAVPAGVQIIAPPGRDDICAELAAWLEGRLAGARRT
ncbi:amidase [Aeromicrobium phragmitis]|uniref:Amidase n=1 Tax=Aeromicrobium phragmitis TaxID=2478914 RepID=A0A3L8PR55_9ACTN|nr:amidase [Aeromicrobium phragmitis]RLV57359.1 amidase [Aeromicrobium phragmitis]